MPHAIATVSTRILRERVNQRLDERHSESYISRVKNGRAGASALRDVVRQEMRHMFLEAAAALETKPEAVTVT